MTAAVEATATVEPERPAVRPQARSEALQPASHENLPLRVIWAGPDVEPEDLRYEGYFKKLIDRHQFRFGDRLEIRGHGHDWRVELTVLASKPDGLEVHFDKITSFKAPSEPEDSDGTYTIRHDGGAQPWVVMRDSSDAIMPGRYATRDAARVARAKLHPKGL